MALGPPVWPQPTSEPCLRAQPPNLTLATLRSVQLSPVPASAPWPLLETPFPLLSLPSMPWTFHRHPSWGPDPSAQQALSCGSAVFGSYVALRTHMVSGQFLQ